MNESIGETNSAQTPSSIIPAPPSTNPQSEATPTPISETPLSVESPDVNSTNEPKEDKLEENITKPVEEEETPPQQLSNQLSELEIKKQLQLKQQRSLLRLAMNGINQNMIETLNKASEIYKENENHSQVTINEAVEEAVEKCEKEKENEMKEEIRKIKSQYDEEIEELKYDNKEKISELNHKISELKKESKENDERANHFEELYLKEREKRKKIEVEVMDLKGNIRVFCRVRPLLKVEIENGDTINTCTYPLEGDISVKRSADFGPDNFEFDYVFQPHSTQEEVYTQVHPFVKRILDGYNLCIFAYGQTGSGKTFTMQGPENNNNDSNVGVNYRAIEDIFKITNKHNEYEWEYEISVFEVYNENIIDLLTEEKSFKNLEIHLNEYQKPYVDGLIKYNINKYEEVIELLAKANKNRFTASHNLNEHSSRSHLILTMSLYGNNTENGRTLNTKINLIDLAGSERVSKTEAIGERLKEAQNINKSLSSLGDVIFSLDKKKSHIPYRNSKLTYVLQDSLSGNSKVLMFVNISPAHWNVSETLSSLNFAQHCRKCELGNIRNDNSDDNNTQTPINQRRISGIKSAPTAAASPGTGPKGNVNKKVSSKNTTPRPTGVNVGIVKRKSKITTPTPKSDGGDELL